MGGFDNCNKRCFGTKPKLFRESGDFSGNRDPLGNFYGKNAYGKPIVAIFNNLINIQFSIYIYVVFFVLVQFNIYNYGIFLKYI